MEGTPPDRSLLRSGKMDKLPASRSTGETLALHATGDLDGMERYSHVIWQMRGDKGATAPFH